MSEQDQKAVAEAIKHITSKITSLIEGAKCEYIDNSDRMAYIFKVFFPEKNQRVTKLIFSRASMEDFSAENTSYGIRFRYYIDFKIYTELIKVGLLSSFRISNIFIQEIKDRDQNDWWSNRYVRVAFDNKITAVFVVGLNKLKEVVEKTFSENVVDPNSLSELKEDLDRINGVLDYYNVHKSLDETSASINSLSILKAAAIYAIVEKERKRNQSRPYLTSKINQEICSIATFLREGAFLEVRPPEWLGDYVAV